MLPAKDTYKFQRRGSVFQRDLNRPDTERCAWQGPPLDVSLVPSQSNMQYGADYPGPLCWYLGAI